MIWLGLLIATEAFALSQVRPSRGAYVAIIGITTAVVIVGILAVRFGYRRVGDL